MTTLDAWNYNKLICDIIYRAQYDYKALVNRGVVANGAQIKSLRSIAHGVVGMRSDKEVKTLLSFIFDGNFDLLWESIYGEESRKAVETLLKYQKGDEDLTEQL